MLVLVGAGLLAGPAVMAGVDRCVELPPWGGRYARTGATAVVSAACALLFPVGQVWLESGLVTLAWCWACAWGCGLVVTDVLCRRLPFRLVAVFAGGGAVVLLAAAASDRSWARCGAAFGAAVVVLALAMLLQIWAPHHTGGGDTALYGAVALYLGWFGWTALLRGLLMASSLTAVVALAIAVRSGRMSTTFPAGPPVLVGALASMLVA